MKNIEKQDSVSDAIITGVLLNQNFKNENTHIPNISFFYRPEFDESPFIGMFCHFFLLPFYFARTIKDRFARESQQLIIFIYMIVLTIILYLFITNFLLPVKTYETVLFIQCILYWILFLLLVMFLLNNSFNIFVL